MTNEARERILTISTLLSLIAFLISVAVNFWIVGSKQSIMKKEITELKTEVLQLCT